MADLSTYHAEYTALTQRIEALQADMQRTQQEAQRRLAELKADLDQAALRRAMVEGAIEALS